MAWTIRSGASTDWDRFFQQYGSNGVRPFLPHAILIASAYGARMKRWWTVPQHFFKDIAEKLAGVRTGAEERDALVEILGEIEREFSRDLRLEDRKGLDFRGSGDKSQMDCVDEAWNITAALLWIDNHVIRLKFHTIREPMSKLPFFRWNHYGAILRETYDGKLWAVDGGVRRGGEPPIIIDADVWYE